MTDTLINSEEWFGSRRVEWMPAHFTKVSSGISSRSFLGNAEKSKIENWITKNTDGRYAIENIVISFDPVVTKVMIAFEDPKEALYFRLQFSS